MFTMIRKNRKARTVRVQLEQLEERTLLSTVPITVTSLADSGTGTLRAAITTADAGSISNQYAISFASGLSGTINLTEALPNLNNNISITGPGASSLTVNRVSTAAHFSIFTTTGSNKSYYISGVTISGGTYSHGGGIDNLGAFMLTVTNSTITNNSASDYGGGIDNQAGPCTVINSTFTGNSACDGGGIFNGYAMVLMVINSTFTGNSATQYGGGICSDPYGVITTLTNSTISGNSATSYGGVIYNNPGCVLTLNNTIVANNASTPGYDIYGPILPSSNNLIGNGTDLSSLNSTNLIGTTSSPLNPDLGLLQNNGGPTETMALLPESPAIGAGSVALAVDQNGVQLTTDQCGNPRTTNGYVDIGAYEFSINQSIIFGTLANQIYGVASITLNATDTSSLPITYNVVSGPATVSGDTLTITGAGTVTVVASQAGNDEYLAATPVDESFTVAQATPTMSVIDNGGSYTSTAYTATTTVNGQPSLESVTPTLDYQQLVNGTWQDLGTTAPVNAGSYDVTANFAGSTDYLAAASTTVDFNISQATATISVTPYNVNYDGKVHIAAVTATGVNGVNLNSDITITGSRTNVHDIGASYSYYNGAYTYMDTWTFTDPNYSSANGTIVDTISQAAATITVTPYNVIYDGKIHMVTGTATGVNGVDLTSDLDPRMTANTLVGSTWGTWNFIDPNGNYTSVSGWTFDTINKATATIVVTPYNVTYDGLTHSANGTVTDVNGVTLPSNDLVLSTTHTNAGIYNDTWTFIDSNYWSQSGMVTDAIIINPSMALVTTLYNEVLGRAPDQGGLADWVNVVNSGATLQQVVNSFWNSPEHKSGAGSEYVVTYDAANAFTCALYQDMLGRNGDSGGVNGWNTAMINGYTSNQAVTAFWNSTEHQLELYRGTAPASIYSKNVTALYTDLLGRSPDVAGLNSWVNLQYSGTVTTTQIAQCFAGSTEFAARTSQLPTSQFITFLYNSILDRAPDAGGLAAWDLALDSHTISRTQAVLAFWDSPEHVRES